jgi:hypothetical protein
MLSYFKIINFALKIKGGYTLFYIMYCIWHDSNKKCVVKVPFCFTNICTNM